MSDALQLMSHQSMGAGICGKDDRFGFWYDTGTGKTIMILAALAASKAARNAEALIGEKAERVRAWGAELDPAPYRKSLVISTKAIIANAWADDVQHFPGLSFKSCWAKGKAARSALIKDSEGVDLLGINFENFKQHRRDFYDAGVRRLIVDESSKLKNPETQITKACIEFADHIDSVYCLSGSPAPNSDMEYFGQMRCIDPEVFGKNYYRFANEYFSPQKRWVNGKQVTVGWSPKESRRDAFLSRLRQKSIVVRKADCLDLPPQTDVDRFFDLSPEESRVYGEVESLLRAEIDGAVLNTNAQAAVNKLRQVCSGWAYGKDKDALHIGSTKLAALGELLDEIGDHGTITWIDYREDAQRVKAMLDERGEESVVLDGSTKDGDVKPAVEAFQAGELKRLVCHPASVGHGLTLTAGSYAVYYSPIWSSELYIQSRDRIHRKGQTQNTTYYHLIGRGTIEESVLWACRNKKAKAEAVMAMINKEGS